MRYKPGGRAEAPAPTEGYKECDGRADVGIGPYGSATRSAVSGPSGTPAPTEAYLVVRRGGALPLPRATARVAPTEGLQEVRCGEESPSHGFAVPAPFRQGGRGDGGADYHTSDTFIVLCVILFGGAAEEKGAEGFAVPGEQGVKLAAARYGLGGGH